jgi:hypothetical protein
VSPTALTGNIARLEILNINKQLLLFIWPKPFPLGHVDA